MRKACRPFPNRGDSLNTAATSKYQKVDGRSCHQGVGQRNVTDASKANSRSITLVAMRSI